MSDDPVGFMKKRTTKKDVTREELNLAANLRDALAQLTDGRNTIEGRWATMLGSDLTFLTMWQLRLNSTFPKAGWWIDSIEWESLGRESHALVRGSGQLYWGYSNKLSGRLTSEPFSAELQLVRVSPRPRVVYTLTGKMGDRKFEIKNQKK